MGCGSSKLVPHEIEKQNPDKNGDYCTTDDHHVVLLTSSTYGALKLDDESHETHPLQKPELEVMNQITLAESMGAELKKSMQEPPEIINLWEIMQGIEEELPPAIRFPKPPECRVSPRKTAKKIGGKENKEIPINNGIIRSLMENTPRSVLKELNNLPDNPRKPFPTLWLKFSTLKNKHISEEEEGIEKTIPEKAKRPKCPPGGENVVVIYTTTLQGIRKTFDDCNLVRSIIKLHSVQTIERDISMHSGFKEELRLLMMGSGEAARVPLVFVKGRLIGGAEEMVKLEEEGRLGSMLEGVPPREGGVCSGCNGVGFVVCGECDGSCRVWGEDGRRSAKCRECNENGLLLCPLCC